jgi:4-carboxymuconolactone decarboxylase
MLGLSFSAPYLVSTLLLSTQGNFPSAEHINTSSGFSPRYNGPDIGEMNEEQKAIRDKILASRKGTGLSGPFGPWLAIPEIAEPSQELGRACRYGTSLSFRESELVILLTGAKTRSHAEFDIHVGEALKAGLSMEIIQSIPRDDDFSMAAVEAKLAPLLANDREVAIARFTAELLDTYTVSDETYAKSKAALGDKDTVLVEVVAITGYYTYVAYTLNTFRIPSKTETK